MAKYKRKLAGIDSTAWDKLNDLKLTASEKEGKTISTRELTRRMIRTKSFSGVEKEIITDAEMKKILRRGR